MWDMQVSDPRPLPLSRSAIPVAPSAGTRPVFVLNSLRCGRHPGHLRPLTAQAGPRSHPSRAPSPDHTSHW